MTDLARAALLATSALLALLAACASPGGAATDGGVAAANGNSCNPGEVQVCELRTPHRVSDGRYGFRGNTRKSCSCQPDSDLQRMSRETLPGDQF